MVTAVPLAPGDRILLIERETQSAGVVLDVSSWKWILIRCDDAVFYLDVVFKNSTMSWSRVVRLMPGVDVTYRAVIDRIAEQTGYHIWRTDVGDVDGAAMHCPVTTQLRRCPKS